MPRMKPAGAGALLGWLAVLKPPIMRLHFSPLGVTCFFWLDPLHKDLWLKPRQRQGSSRLAAHLLLYGVAVTESAYALIRPDSMHLYDPTTVGSPGHLFRPRTCRFKRSLATSRDV